MRRILAVFSILTVTLASQLLAATRLAPEHPRLMFASSLCGEAQTPAKIAARLGREPYSGWFERMSTDDFHTGALRWLLTSQSGGNAADSVADRIIEKMRALPVGDGGFHAGENLQRMALAYDWLYHYPGFTDQIKDELRTKMLAMAETVISVVNGDTVVWGEDLFHNYCSNAAAGIGLTALALWQGPDDREVSRILRIAEDWYFNRSFKGMELLCGAWHEGMAYSLNHIVQETPIWVAAYRTASGIDWFDKIRREQGDWMQKWIYFCLSSLRPDWTFIRTGDMGASRMLPDRTLRQAIEIITSAYRNGHGKFLIDELENRLADRAISPGDLWMPVIFYDDKLESRDYRELNPTMIVSPDRLGHMTMRSGWGPDATFIHFECGDYFGSHNHIDQGQFTIYHKGSLALDSGYYDGYTEHHKKYAYRAIAHNTILVKDPEETVVPIRFPPYPNPGGQRSIDKYYNNSNYRMSVFWEQYRQKAYADIADIVAWESHAAFDYVAGDMTAAYNSTAVSDPGQRAKVSLVQRRILFVKPSIIAVCDNVNALDASFEKKWLLHTVNEPRIAADKITTVAEGEGQLILTPVLPADVRVTKIGGPGKEFMVNDKNMAMEKAPYLTATAQPGAWRLELIPGAPRQNDIYLNLMETSDKGAAPQFSFEKSVNESFSGAVADTLAIIFTSEIAPESSSLEIPETARSCTTYYIAGLKRDTVFRIYSGENHIDTINSGKAGAVRLQSASGISSLRLID